MEPITLVLVGIVVLAALIMIIKRLVKFGCILLLLAVGVVLYFLYLR